MTHNILDGKWEMDALKSWLIQKGVLKLPDNISSTKNRDSSVIFNAEVAHLEMNTKLG